jgi:hypothetical protein
MMTASPSPYQRRRLPFLVVLIAAFAVAALGLVGIICLFGLLGYGWDMPKGRAIPVLFLYFLAGIAALQRGKSTLFRGFVFILATILAVPAWWLTPQNHVSLRQAGKWHDELKAEFSSPPSWEHAYRVSDIKDKYAKLYSASRSLTQTLPMDDRDWTFSIGEAIYERFRTTPPEDIEQAIETKKAESALNYSGAPFNASHIWVKRALALQIDDLTRLPEADWAGFDRSAPARLRLAETFLMYHDLEQLIAAEEKWGFSSAAKALDEARASKDPKVIGAACSGAEKQLLALNSAEKTRKRFRAARELLFLVAIRSAQEEIQKYSDAKNYDAAYGIARKLAVDWFATAEMLGSDKAKLLETLRENCRLDVEAADAAANSPEVAPPPRSREIAPPPRSKS